jgi:hypothetical protein
MSEIKQEIQQLKSNIDEKLDGVRSDIKELTKAFRDLVRLDGDIKRVDIVVDRIGRQVDDQEKRLRAVETSGAINGNRISSGERIRWLIFSVSCSGVASLVVYVMSEA